MGNIFLCELIKLKRSKMLWLVLIGALLPVILNYMVALNQLESKPFIKWDDMFQDNLFIMTVLMSPALFALFTGYIISREYQERTINSLFTVPRSRTQLLIGKYITMLTIMLLTLVLVYVLTLGSGFLLKHDALTFAVLWKYVQYYAIHLLLQFSLISAAVTVSLLGKSYIPAMGLGVFAVISELTIMQSKYIMYYPWSASTGFMLYFSDRLNPETDVTVGIYTLVLVFVLPLLFNVWYYRKADVHSG